MFFGVFDCEPGGYIGMTKQSSHNLMSKTSYLKRWLQWAKSGVSLNVEKLILTIQSRLTNTSDVAISVTKGLPLIVMRKSISYGGNYVHFSLH